MEDSDRVYDPTITRGLVVVLAVLGAVVLVLRTVVFPDNDKLFYTGLLISTVCAFFGVWNYVKRYSFTSLALVEANRYIDKKDTRRGRGNNGGAGGIGNLA